MIPTDSRSTVAYREMDSRNNLVTPWLVKDLFGKLYLVKKVLELSGTVLNSRIISYDLNPEPMPSLHGPLETISSFNEQRSTATLASENGNSASLAAPDCNQQIEVISGNTTITKSTVVSQESIVVSQDQL